MQQLKTFLWILVCTLTSQAAFSQIDASFELRNQQRVGSTYSFDVYMKASQTGTFHSRGQVYVYYNTAAFGNAIVAQGGVTITPLTLLNDSIFGSPKYTTINIADNGNRVAATWQLVFQSIPASGAILTEVPDTMQALYHFEMDMIDTSKPAGIAFDWNLMSRQQFYILPNTTAEIEYSVNNLPVTWAYVNAEAQPFGQVDIRWGTETELNNDYFVVERHGGDGFFEAIGQVTGNGRSEIQQTYTFTDVEPFIGRQYYRIRQVDIDGTFSFSDAVSVEVSGDDIAQFTLGPVPATDWVHIIALRKSVIAYPYDIFDAQGKQIAQGILSPDQERVSISTQALPAGIYRVRLTGPNQTAYGLSFIKK